MDIDSTTTLASDSVPRRETPAQSAKIAISRGASPNDHDLRPRHNSLSIEQSLVAFRPAARSLKEAKEASDDAKRAEKARDTDKQTLEWVRKHQRPQPTSIRAMFQSARVNQDAAPSWEQLEGIIKRAFPEPMQMPVFICDIKDSEAHTIDTQVGDVERYWQQGAKPDDVHVRWIHIPLGTGILQSSLEDMFLYAGPETLPGRSFEHAGLTGFPYLELDSLHLQSTSYLQYLKDVHATLKEEDQLNRILNPTVLRGNRNETLNWDVRWRLKQFDKELDYWAFVASDLPHQLSEGVTLSDNGPLRPANILDHELDRSSTSTSELLKGANLVVAPFRCFHRRDGMLLTMSAATGVDYLDKNFPQHIRETIHHRLRNPFASVVGNVRAMLEDNGAKHWPRKTVDEFLVYLVTEIGMTPHNMCSGRNAPSLLSVFHCEVQEIKRRRHNTWRPNDETKSLVEKSLLCLDNLNAIKLSYDRKLAFFSRLEKDVSIIEGAAAQDQRGTHTSPAVWTCPRRIRLVQQYLQRERVNAEHLIKDLTQVNDTLYQIKTLEQNELAIMADSQNKAILVFTGVTVIFLPLSFFTSYFGMSFRGIAKSRYGESLFWFVSLPSTVLIILVVALGVVYGNEIAHWLVRPPRRVPLKLAQESHEKSHEV